MKVKMPKIHSIFYRDFKIWALDLLRKEDEKERKEQEVDEERIQAERERGQQSAPGPSQHNKTKKRIQLCPWTKVAGKRRLELHSQWIDEKCNEIDKSIAFLERRQRGVMKAIMEEMSRDFKSSHLANEEFLQRYNQAANKQRDRAVQSRHLVDITPWMEGSVILAYLYDKDGARPFVLAELKKRGIQYKPTKKVSEMNKKELGKHKLGWAGCTIRTMQNELREHEHGRLAREEGQHLKDFKEVKNIKPLSQKIQEWMPKQWEIYKRRKGQVHEEAKGS
jgi:hypothetical protein